jgi:putative ABC transport system permease protein
MRRIRAALESFRIALAALRANPARGVLTTLGIIIGIVAVATTMTAANGLAVSFRENVSILGTDVLYVSRFPWIFEGRFFELRNRPRLTLKDSDKLERNLRTAVAVNPTAETMRPIKYRSETLDRIRIIGTTDKQMLVSSAVPELGRFFTEFDVQTRRRVCVIGTTIHEQLFGGRDPLNKKLKVGRDAFRVIGVMEKQGSAGFFGGPDFDSQVLIPITTFSKVFGGHYRDFNLAVKAPPGVDVADFEFELIGEMRKIRRLEPGEDDDFAINKMDSLLEAFNNVMGVLLLIGMSVTGISLFVGGVGVMNIMFVSVTERTREIGIRKAIGAKRRAIMQQFLFEAAAICLVGGAIGVALAFGVAEIIDRALMPASLSLPIVGLALGVAILTGLIAGLIPAWRASRLNPIEALRYE